jgi:aminoglycoside phosphotransferase (APT) family kinase protein
VPLAWTHGDFFLGNCLSDAAGGLTGVVDWELFSTAGLPLLDLLQCMVVPGETSSHPTWQRFDRVCGFIGTPSELYRWPEVSRYLDSMEVPAACVPSLLRMYWVDHVANRIAARGTDPVWMQKRVYQPLEALNRVDSSASATVVERAR